MSARWTRKERALSARTTRLVFVGLLVAVAMFVMIQVTGSFWK